MNILRLSTLSLTIVLFTLGGLISPENTTLAHHCKGSHSSAPECEVGGGGGVIRVDVSFRNSVGDGLKSDGLGTYKHKKDKVSAEIGGGFALKLTKGKQPAIRTLFLDFTDCVSGDGTCIPPFQTGSSFGPLTINASGVDLLALVEDETRTDLRLALNLDLDLVGGGVWVLVFDNDGFGICPKGIGKNSDINVKRIGSADEWEIEATSLDVACLVKNDQGAMDLIFSGLYKMPFKMTVVKQN